MGAEGHRQRNSKRFVANVEDKLGIGILRLQLRGMQLKSLEKTREGPRPQGLRGSTADPAVQGNPCLDFWPPGFSENKLVLLCVPTFMMVYGSGGLPWWLSGKECLQCRRHGIDPWVEKMSWRREWQATPVFLPGKCYGQRSLTGYSCHNDLVTKQQLQQQ